MVNTENVMSWTDERVEQLTKLWADGLSASQIAAQLGGVSRNAVIGKVHRLHLPGRAKSGGSRAPRAKRPATTTRTYTSRAGTSAPRNPSTRGSGSGAAATALNTDVDAVAFQEVDIRPIEDVVVPISKKLKLVELGENTCKWPIGDPMADDFHFCGNDSADSAPYCKYHSKLAYQPTSERRRSR
jgi:GcrA cell cycle regulator